MTAKTGPITKAQHTVPRLHLQHFAGDRPAGQVWTYDKSTGKKRSAIPDETSTFTHFYSVALDDGTYDTSVETKLSENETKAGPIYRKLISGNIPENRQERADFALFISLLYLRTPAVRQDTANIIGRTEQIVRYAHGAHDAVFNTLIRKVEKKRGEKIAPEIKENFRRKLMDPSGEILRVKKAQTLKTLNACDELAPILFNMEWSLVTARQGFFITSDNPVVRIVEPKTVHPFYGDHGFINRTAQVTLALTPKLMLLMTHRDAFPRNSIVERKVVDFWNVQRAYRADRFLYAHLEHVELQRLAARFRGSRPVASTQGFGPDTFAEIIVPRR